MKKIILISGKAEAGKTASALYLKAALETRGQRVAIIPYGQYVKDSAKMLFGWDGKKDENGRHLLQWWGTDVVRKEFPDFWVNTVVRLVGVAVDQLDYVLVDDCRFPNEASCWDEYPHLTVRVERPGYENHLTYEQRLHPSETAMDGFKFDVTVSATDLDSLEDGLFYDVLPRVLCRSW